MATWLRRLVLLMLPVTLWQASLAAQVSGTWSKCNMDSLAIWNCAQYHPDDAVNGVTGTETITSHLVRR